MQYPISNVHALSVGETLISFQTDAERGISQHEADRRIKQFGTNVYAGKKQKSLWFMLIGQLKSPIVYLLVFGAAVSFYFNETLEAFSIIGVIVINAAIGFLMEVQARSSMNALRQMEVILSKVIRGGLTVEIPAEKLTPGDLVVLAAGDLIPGDGRLIESNQLQCDESSLTGESMPTQKDTEKLPTQTVLADRDNMIYKGASVINGTGKAIITGVSHNTELGTITSLVENSGQTATPLDKKLNTLTRKLIWITLIMTLIFAVTGIIQGKKWALIIETSIALTVAAIPEGLPIVATVALGYGMVLMARRNVIVKKLSAVETLGSTNVILTDKTGTLTENAVYVETFSFVGENEPERFEKDLSQFVEGPITPGKINFEKLRMIGALCNDASIELTQAEQKLSGDPIEKALLQLMESSGGNVRELRATYQRVEEIPFSSESKIMGTMHKSPDGQFVAGKGSVEHLLAKCSKSLFGNSIKEWSTSEKTKVLKHSEVMASEGLRVLAFAYKEGEFDRSDFLNDLIYVGMIGFLDPPRADVADAIRSCRNAGIRIVMITGDHPMTAMNIAKKIGLIDQDEVSVIIGMDLPPFDTLTDDWRKRILSTSVFARTTPKQKLEIASVYQSAGNVVAMTGDGVNDAPALKKADVGIAMGLRGTEAAKEAASIVLKDDSFSSIAHAVARGREIFQNIQKFVIYLVSCNLSEILIVSTLGFVAPASTLLPLQILFLNMVTDVFPALALGLGQGDNTVMDKSPRTPGKEIITNRDWIIISLYALAITTAVMIAVLFSKYYFDANDRVMNNVAFVTLTFAQLVHVFNMSSLRSAVLVNEVTKNKFVWLALFLCVGLLALVFAIPKMHLVLKLGVLPIRIWLTCIAASLIPLVFIQTYKSLWARFAAGN